MKMTKVRTADLIGAQLDWAVEKAIGRTPPEYLDGYMPQAFSTSWSAGGPIIESFRIEILAHACSNGWWAGIRPIIPVREFSGGPASGPTHLIAAMRAVVSYIFGKEVEVPEIEL